MTPNQLLQSLVPLVADLARDLPSADRYRKLLDAIRAAVPADAVALLRLEGERLVPLAAEGLDGDILGRRFVVGEHPRFQALLDAPGCLHFAPDCPWPDPYDGLVEAIDGHIVVHDCMGCALRVDGRTWGVVTLDAAHPGTFLPAHIRALEVLAGAAAATVSVVARMDDLETRAEAERLRADSFRLAAGQATGRALTGRSASMRRLLDEIALAGPSALPVLITGETGVGKELVARALHDASARAGKPLVTVNCAALPETLVESELFGHERGAFSGAVAHRRGRFDLADGGTLFLDEIGELPLGVQAKLLRVLEGGHLQRLGSDREHRVDVRLVSATNRDLQAEVDAGRFRADLFHRLGGYPLRVPPLRERGRDVLLLAGAFLEENRARFGLGTLRLDAHAKEALLRHAWPGNVRELEHVLGRAAIRALGRQSVHPRVLTLAAADLDIPPPSPADRAAAGSVADQSGAGADASGAGAPLVTTPAPSDIGLREAVERLEREAITAALARHRGNWAAVARDLHMDRANVRRMAQRLGLATKDV